MTDDPSTTVVLTDTESRTVAEAGSSAAAVVAAAHDLSVESAEQAERAGGILRDLQTVRKRAERDRLALTKPHREHVTLLNDQYREPSRMLDEADRVIRGKVKTYLAEQERLRAERQAELDRIAAEQRRADEAKRERLAAEARAQREAWERAQAEREAEAKRTNGEAERLAADAARAAAEAMANLERARELAPLPVRPVETVAAAKPGEGIAVKRPWTFEVTHPNEVPAAFTVVDEQAIRRRMREDVRESGAPKPIPGVRFYQDETLAVRGR